MTCRTPRGQYEAASRRVEDAAYEALLAGSLRPADADEGLRPLAEAVAALTVAPSAREAAGEEDARAAYRAEFVRPSRPARAGRRRRRVLASVLAAKLAAAAVVTAGGLTAAAYANVLPAPVQNFAHRTVGAPAPHAASPAGRPATPAGPGPSGPGASHPGRTPSAAPSHSPAGRSPGKTGQSPGPTRAIPVTRPTRAIPVTRPTPATGPPATQPGTPSEDPHGPAATAGTAHDPAVRAPAPDRAGCLPAASTVRALCLLLDCCSRGVTGWSAGSPPAGWARCGGRRTWCWPGPWR